MKKDTTDHIEQLRKDDINLRTALQEFYAEQPPVPKGLEARLAQSLAARQQKKPLRRIALWASWTMAVAALLVVAFLLTRPEAPYGPPAGGDQNHKPLTINHQPSTSPTGGPQGAQPSARPIGTLDPSSARPLVASTHRRTLNPQNTTKPQVTDPIVPHRGTTGGQPLTLNPKPLIINPKPSTSPTGGPQGAPSASLYRFNPKHLEELIAKNKKTHKAPTQKANMSRLADLADNDLSTKHSIASDLAFNVTYSNYAIMEMDLSALLETDVSKNDMRVSSYEFAAPGSDHGTGFSIDSLNYRPLLSAKENTQDSEDSEASQAPRRARRKAPNSAIAEDAQLFSYRYTPYHQSHHSLPLTFGLSVQKQFNRYCALETGLTYTRLASDFTTIFLQQTLFEEQRIHYIGIPLKFNVNVLNSKHWNAYAAAGIAVDLPVNATIETHYTSRIDSRTEKHHVSAPVQFLAAAGIGLQYKFNKHIGLYVEPSAQWYAPNGSSLETYRTAHPLMFTVPIGLRWTL